LHVPGDPQNDGDRPKAAKDASNPDGVGDRIAKPEPGRHVEVDLRRAGAPDLDRVDHVVGAPERLAPVEVRGDRRLRPERAGRPAGHSLRGRQALRVDVVERDLGRPQRGRAEDVAEEVPREHDAARADEDDPGHGYSGMGHRWTYGRPDVQPSRSVVAIATAPRKAWTSGSAKRIIGRLASGPRGNVPRSMRRAARPPWGGRDHATVPASSAVRDRRGA